MKNFIRMILLLLTLTPLIVWAFDGWRADQSIARKDSAALILSHQRII